MKCKNCGAELVQISDGKVMHSTEINIGTELKPYLVKGAVLMSRTTNCYYPEKGES